MPSRARFALIVSGLLAVVAIALGLDVAITRSCESGSGCIGGDVAWVIGLSLVALGIGVLVGAALGWRWDPGLTAQMCCYVWTGALLLTAAAIGGASNVDGVLLAIASVVMGAMSAWVPR